MSITTLRLGIVDQGAMPPSKKDFLAPFHAVMDPPLQAKLAFRDEPDNVWQNFEEVPGTSVRDLQQFLKDTGFLPRANVDGIFGYVTQAGVRLFQEYVRTIDGDASVGTPDGKAGPNTFRIIEEWKSKKQGKPEYVCQWGQASAQAGSEEFNKWLSVLAKAKAVYSTTPHPILKYSEEFRNPSDTLKVKDWDTSPDSIHLIGIRRNQETSLNRRVNDDIFVFLIKGMVFKFWGSTDPNQNIITDRKDEPFLIEGQHKFKFAWHKKGDSKQVYRAMKPAKHGVLVFRDRHNTNSLQASDIAKGLDAKPNLSINIHWSGKGETNFSAGCQVLAGQSYSNHQGKVIDCSGFAAPGYKDLSNGKTRGAYNLFTDLILCYAPAGVQTITYTLARDESFLKSTDFHIDMITAWEGNLKSNQAMV